MNPAGPALGLFLAQASPAQPAQDPAPPPVQEPAPPEEVSKEPSGKEIVVAYNAGFRWGIAPGVFFPKGGGRAALALGAQAGYGILADPVIVTPGVSVTFLFPEGGTTVFTLGTLRLMLPIGAFAPFVKGGAGPAFLSLSSEAEKTALALQGGGGAIYYFGLRFGLGVEATYTAVLGTGVGALGIGPILLIGF